MVNNFLKNGRELLIRRQNSILSAALILMLAILASRILGLVRDRLLAGAYFIPGQEWQLDVYFSAFRIPDMLFQLLVLGALSAAFIPVFSQLSQVDEKHAWKVASTIINAGTLFFLAISLIIFLWTPYFCKLIAPNFSGRELSLMVNLTRLMLLAQMFFIVSNILTGILQSYQRFLIPALAPVFYNIGIILGILLLSPFFGIYGATVGVVLGAFLHFIIQLPVALHLGFSYQPVLALTDPAVRRIGRLMLPRTLALAVSQIELTVTVFIATSLTAGSLSLFYFAQHLNDLPVGLFGLTIGQAALPVLAVEATKNQENFKRLLLASLKDIFFLALPASVLLLVLRIPMVRLAFGAKTFPWEATLITGRVVALFALSVFAQAGIQVLVRAFYALQDTKTPFYTATLAVLVSVALAFALTFGLHMDVMGLALAVSLSSFFHIAILIGLLQKKTGFINRDNFWVPVLKIIFVTSLMAIALWLPMRLLDQYMLDTTRTINLIILTLLATVLGLMVYIGLSALMKIEELGRFLGLLSRFGRWRAILSQSEEYLDGANSTGASLTGKE